MMKKFRRMKRGLAWILTSAMLFTGVSGAVYAAAPDVTESAEAVADGALMNMDGEGELLAGAADSGMDTAEEELAGEFFEEELPGDDGAAEDQAEEEPEDEPQDEPQDEPEDEPQEEPEDVPQDEPEDVPQDEPEEVPQDEPSGGNEADDNPEAEPADEGGSPEDFFDEPEAPSDGSADEETPSDEAGEGTGDEEGGNQPAVPEAGEDIFSQQEAPEDGQVDEVTLSAVESAPEEAADTALISIPVGVLSGEEREIVSRALKAVREYGMAASAAELRSPVRSNIAAGNISADRGEGYSAAPSLAGSREIPFLLRSVDAPLVIAGGLPGTAVVRLRAGQDDAVVSEDPDGVRRVYEEKEDLEGAFMELLSKGVDASKTIAGAGFGEVIAVAPDENGNLVVDTTSESFGQDAFIVIAADVIAPYLTDGRLLIRKRGGQTIAFSLSQENISIGRYVVESDGALCDTTASTSDEQNRLLRENIVSDIIWNVRGVSTLSLANTAGTFLVSGSEAKAVVEGDSSGTILVNGTLVAGAAWNYLNRNAVSTATLAAETAGEAGDFAVYEVSAVTDGAPLPEHTEAEMGPDGRVTFEPIEYPNARELAGAQYLYEISGEDGSGEDSGSAYALVSIADDGSTDVAYFEDEDCTVEAGPVGFIAAPAAAVGGDEADAGTEDETYTEGEDESYTEDEDEAAAENEDSGEIIGEGEGDVELTGEPGEELLGDGGSEEGEETAGAGEDDPLNGEEQQEDGGNPGDNPDDGSQSYEPVEFTFKVGKTYNIQKGHEGEEPIPAFHFTLTPPKDRPGDEDEIDVTPTKAGEREDGSFTTVQFEKPGNYTYKIVETDLEAKGFVCDPTEWTLTAKVEETPMGLTVKSITAVSRKPGEEPQTYSRTDPGTFYGVEFTNWYAPEKTGTFSFKDVYSSGGKKYVISNDSFTLLEINAERGTEEYRKIEKILATGDIAVKKMVKDGQLRETGIKPSIGKKGLITFSGLEPNTYYAIRQDSVLSQFQPTKAAAVIRVGHMPSSGTCVGNWVTEGFVEKTDNGNYWYQLHTKVVISKVDEQGKLLGGAKMKLIDVKSGASVSWDSSDTSGKSFIRLQRGREYRVTEVTAPEGYRRAKDVTFKVENHPVTTEEYAQEIKITDPKNNYKPVTFSIDVTKTLKVREEFLEYFGETGQKRDSMFTLHLEPLDTARADDEQDRNLEYTMSKAWIDNVAKKKEGFYITEEGGRTYYNRDKTVSFKVTYTDTGTFTYEVSEDQSEKLVGYVYDGSIYTATVKVADKDGKLVPSVTWKRDGKKTGAASFANTYQPEQQTQKISAVKKIAGTPSGTETYTFVLKNLRNGKEYSAQIEGAGTVELNEFSLATPGSWQFSIREQAGSADCVYDSGVYTATIDAEDEDGTLDVDITYEKDGKKVSEAVFTNDYRKASFQFHKVRYDNLKQAVNGAKYTIYKIKASDRSSDAYKTAAEHLAAGVVNYDELTQAGSYESADKGKVLFSGLAMNTYFVVREDSAPRGYHRSTHPVIIRTGINKENKPDISVVDSGKDTVGKLQSGIYVWRERPVRLEINKTDSNKDYLAGAKLLIYDTETEKAIAGWVSKEESHVNVWNPANSSKEIFCPEVGHKYRLVEYAPPSGYQKADSYEFTISASEDTSQEYTQVINLVNYKKGESPGGGGGGGGTDSGTDSGGNASQSGGSKTGDTSPILQWVIILLLAAVAVVLLLVLGRRKKR